MNLSGAGNRASGLPLEEAASALLATVFLHREETAPRSMARRMKIRAWRR
jgi:hypothetical protein